MKKFEDFIIKDPYKPDKKEQKAIEELKRKGFKPCDWESGKAGITSLKSNIYKYLIKKQNDCCAYCRIKINRGCDYLQRDHIVPKALHPCWIFETRNLCLACNQCNNNKRDKEVLVDPSITSYPTDSKSFKIVNPYIDKYSDHITILNDVIYKGKTEKGKFTINVCKLSRIDLVLNRARKRMERENPDSVRTQILSLLNPTKKLDDEIQQIHNGLDEMVQEYKEENTLELEYR